MAQQYYGFIRDRTALACWADREGREGIERIWAAKKYSKSGRQGHRYC
jgi:hypothetical protein